MDNIQLIDVDKIVEERNARLYKILPKFLFRWLRRLIHQEQMNNILKRAGNKVGQDFLKVILEDIQAKIEYSGLENVPTSGRYVFAMNHPLGGIDGVSGLYLINRYFGEVKAVVNDLLLYVDKLKPVFTGVNVFGKFSRNQIKELDNLYAGEKHIIVFPAGLASRKNKRKIADLTWKKSFLSKAIEHKRDIVPVYVEAQNSPFFYNFANFRKFIRIKINIELILLPKEMFKQKGKEIVFHFGKPISYKKLQAEKKTHKTAQELRELVYKIEKEKREKKRFEL